MDYAVATHQNPDISGLFSIYELIINEKYEFKFAKRSTKFLLKTPCLSQYIITPPLSKNHKNCARWMTSKQQMPSCAATSFIIIYHYYPVISQITSTGYKNQYHQFCNQLP